MIHDEVSQKYSVVNTTIKFGVLQSLADVQPDVDAIYRLTKETPFNFKRPIQIPSPAEQRGNKVSYYVLFTFSNYYRTGYTK